MAHSRCFDANAETSAETTRAVGLTSSLEHVEDGDVLAHIIEHATLQLGRDDKALRTVILGAILNYALEDCTFVVLVQALIDLINDTKGALCDLLHTEDEEHHGQRRLPS